MKYVGKPTPVFDAIAKVTGEAQYTDDLMFPGMLWGAILYSPHAHARIVSIDTAEAENYPGVHGVVTYKDSPDTLYCRNMRAIHDKGPAKELVFSREVRFVGDRVAAVAAETEEIARKALKLIKVEYEMLPAVFDPEEAAQKDSPKVYSDSDTNIIKISEKHCGDVEKAFEEADHVVSSFIQTAPIHHAAIEPHICIGYWSRMNEISVWEPQRAPFRMQIMLAKIFGLPYSKVHVHGMVIGGTFGSKEGVMLEPVCLLLSRKTGRHVKIRMNRSECIVSTFTRHALKMYTRLGINNDGTIHAIDVKAYMRVGAYCGDSLTVLIGMQGKFFKLYNAPNMRFTGIPAYTNTPLGGAMRGYGSPNMFIALETAVDKACRELGLDPVEVRRKNLVEPFGEDPTSGAPLGNARIRDCLEIGVESFDFTKRREQCRSMEDENYLYGCGFATTLHGNGVAPNAQDLTVMSIELREDGTVILKTGTSDHGAGSYTIYKQLVAEVLDMPMEHIELTYADTCSGHYDKGAGSSRNTWVGGRCAVDAAKKLLCGMKEVAGVVLAVNPEDVMLKDSCFMKRDGSGKVLTKTDIAEYATEVLRKRLIYAHSYNSPQNAGSYGAHFAQVRIDKWTGEIKVTDYLAVCDVGRAINPMLLTGQIEGAIMIGLGAALFEEAALTETGATKNNNFKKYKIARMKDMPRIEIKLVEKGEVGGPFDAKSIGEASLVPVAPAIINAVNDALGTEVELMPASPDKVLQILKHRQEA